MTGLDQNNYSKQLLCPPCNSYSSLTLLFLQLQGSGKLGSRVIQRRKANGCRLFKLVHQPRFKSSLGLFHQRFFVTVPWHCQPLGSRWNSKRNTECNDISRRVGFVPWMKERTKPPLLPFTPLSLFLVSFFPSFFYRFILYSNHAFQFPSPLFSPPSIPSEMFHKRFFSDARNHGSFEASFERVISHSQFAPN